MYIKDLYSIKFLISQLTFIYHPSLTIILRLFHILLMDSVQFFLRLQCPHAGSACSFRLQVLPAGSACRFCLQFPPAGSACSFRLQVLPESSRLDEAVFDQTVVSASVLRSLRRHSTLLLFFCSRRSLLTSIDGEYRLSVDRSALAGSPRP